MAIQSKLVTAHDTVKETHIFACMYLLYNLQLVQVARCIYVWYVISIDLLALFSIDTVHKFFCSKTVQIIICTNRDATQCLEI